MNGDIPCHTAELLLPTGYNTNQPPELCPRNNPFLSVKKGIKRCTQNFCSHTRHTVQLKHAVSLILCDRNAVLRFMNTAVASVELLIPAHSRLL